MMPVAVGPVVTAVVGRRFTTAHTRFGERAADLEYARSLAAQAGVALRPDLTEKATGNSFEDMGAGLLAALAGAREPSANERTSSAQPAGEHSAAEPAPGERPVDLLVLAHAAPDFAPTTLAAAAIAERIPGDPMVLGVTEQGRATPFTALTLVRSHWRRHSHRRAMVMVFDQSFTPYANEVPDAWRVDGDAAVLLVLEAGPDDSTGSYRVRQEHGVSPEAAAGRLRALFAEADPDGSARVLAGSGVGTSWIPAGHGPVLRGPEGSPATGVLGLLPGLPPGDDAAPLLLVDYDRELGDLSLCRIETVRT
ncbi:hypothetical protein GCM10020367_41400 [Streptomyces sannanensis]|uniref:Uncharacterized protein n=1 Tax=Streptomyces sannanensis TaxID=285536 RepID=A0ABP6SFH7_9ACTN